ncbi:meiotic cell cortex C-terminal pleckstrin homology-domain-containing protein [Fennellomyces sp. T-0311]|nr:meiotic cell cortex C-terminal pleckstrin homology-domain-containing protein [Fennellomyces sp. T-0311]
MNDAVEEYPPAIIEGASSPPTSRKQRLLKSMSLQPSQHKHGNDMELAAEIGQGLLSEVRKMHRLLHENRDSLMALELEKVEQQHQMDSLAKQLKQKCEREEKLNEEVWNLELAKQELLQQVQDMSQHLNKALAEQGRLARQGSLTSRELDQLRSQQIGWSERVEDYEQQLAALRRTVTQLRRENEALNSRHISHESLAKKDNTPDSELQPCSASQVQSTEQASAKEPLQPQRSDEKEPDHEKLEQLQLQIDTLQTSLNHAHQVICTLERDLSYERGERAEIDKLLGEAQETIEGLLQQPEPEVCAPPQPEVSLGYELVNAATAWDTLTQEPITNHSSSEPVMVPKRIPEQRQSNEDYGTFVVKSSTYLSHDPVTEKEQQQQQQQQRRDQALISPARASAFDFDPAFINKRDDNKLKPSDSRATLTTNLVPAVTRTMIGDWMYKYTRKVVGSGISENKHKRFFWIHPYTRTMYWGSREPGMDTHANAKSAMIMSFQVMLDGIDPPSIMVQTPTRSLKVRCLDILAHRAWMKALHYLVADTNTLEPSASLSLLKPHTRSTLLHQMQRSSKSLASIRSSHSFSRPFFEFSFSNTSNG